MKLGGFAGKILTVNLTDRTVTKEPLDDHLAEKFLGGLGMNVKLGYDRIKPGVDPLSPENVIILGVGPLVGTSLPGASRVYTLTKLPESGSIGWSGGGGVVFGYAFKNAGYDHLVIQGRADRPVYIKIVDDDVRICDAGPLWGKGVQETVDELVKGVGEGAGAIGIGQAGENRIAFSMAFIDGFSTLGRGGLGAVMGSKNLKAIVAKGSGAVRVTDRKRFKTRNKGLTDKIRNYPYLKEWQDLGMIQSFPFVPADTYRKIRKRKVACVSCPFGDKDIVEILDGEHKGLVKCTTSVVNLFMPAIYGFEDYRDLIKCVSVIDDYGMDMFEFFGILSFAKDLYEKGIIPKELIDKEIRVNSLASMVTWAQKISLRQGLGNILADGFRGILREYGQAAEQHAPPLIKGMLPYVNTDGPLPWNLFGTMELGQALEPRGPHVGSSGSPTYFAKRPLDVFPKHLKRMGVPQEAVDRILQGLGSQDKEPDLKVGRLLSYSNNWFTVLGSLGVCARAQVNRFYDAALCADLYQAVTGIETSLEELMKRADRVWTLLRMANVRQGFGRKDDTIPQKWYKDAPFQEYLTENPLSAEEYERMIDDYYDERGWDIKTGIPTERKLKELQLETNSYAPVK